MTRSRKIITASIAALTLAGTVAAYRERDGRFEPTHDDRAAPSLLRLHPQAQVTAAPAPCAWAS